MRKLLKAIKKMDDRSKCFMFSRYMREEMGDCCFYFDMTGDDADFEREFAELNKVVNEFK